MPLCPACTRLHADTRFALRPILAQRRSAPLHASYLSAPHYLRGKFNVAAEGRLGLGEDGTETAGRGTTGRGVVRGSAVRRSAFPEKCPKRPPLERVGRAWKLPIYLV